MLKKLAIVLGVVTVLAGVNAINTKSAHAVVNQYDHFCHRTNSLGNPYSSVPFSNNYTEIDGEGSSDHTLHTGPVPLTQAQAQQLKDAHLDWGDIIPPVEGVLPNGLNWTKNGQNVYFSGCAYPAVDNDEPLGPDVNYSVACAENLKVVVTIVNLGDQTGYITVNGEEIEVEAGATTTREFESGTHITVRLDGQEGYDYDQDVVCDKPGMGGGTVTTTDPGQPAVTALPDTAGVNYGLIAGGIAALIIGLSFSAKHLVKRFS